MGGCFSPSHIHYRSTTGVIALVPTRVSRIRYLTHQGGYLEVAVHLFTPWASTLKGKKKLHHR